MSVTFNQLDVLGACALYGPQLTVPEPLSGEAVMQAIAEVESSLGANCGPRQEPAYATGGRYFNPELSATYGPAAESSHGPWQMMFCNFSDGAQEIIGGKSEVGNYADINVYAEEFVRFFNHQVTAHRAQCLSDIGSIWNAGHIQTPLSSEMRAYVAKLTNAYDAATKAGQYNSQ